MATEQARVVTDRLWRKAVLPPMAGGLFFVLLGWTAYVAATMFHYDFFSNDHVVSSDSAGTLRVQMYFWMAIFFTLLGTIGAGLIARSQLNVVKHGQDVVGTIIGLASTRYKGMRKVVVEYYIGDQRFEHASSDGEVAVRCGLNVGDQVAMYVHPKHPNRAVVEWQET